MITGKLDTGLITDGPKKLKELKFTDLFINCRNDLPLVAQLLMGSQDLFFGLSGWLLVILLIYTIIKNHRSVYEFIRNTTIYKWLKDPKNRKK